MNLGKTELKQYAVFFPENIEIMGKDETFNELEKFIEVLKSNDHYQPPVKEYNAAVKQLQDDRAKVKDMLTNTPGLKLFFTDKVEFKNVWLRGFAKFEGCPSKEQF